MIGKGLIVLLHNQRLINAGTMCVAGDNLVGAVQFEENVFIIVDILGRRRDAGNHFLPDSSSETIVTIVSRVVW